MDSSVFAERRNLVSARVPSRFKRSLPGMPCRSWHQSAVHKSCKLPSLYAHEAGLERGFERYVKGRRPITNKLTYFSWINRHQDPSSNKDALNVVLEMDGDQLERSCEKE